MFDTRRVNLKLLTLLTLLLSVSALGQVNTSYYVSTAGSDSNPGTEAAPWRTIQHAADHRHVRAAPSVCEAGLMKNSSASMHPATRVMDSLRFEAIRAKRRFSTPRISPLREEQAIVTIRNRSYVRIEGFEIRNFRTAVHQLKSIGYQRHGIRSHIELLENNVHHIEQTFDGRDAPGHGDNGFGIAVYGTDAKPHHGLDY